MSDVHERFARALSAIGAIPKASKNTHHGYAYRGIDDVMGALHGVLADHGLFYVPRMVDQAYEEWATSKGKRMQVARIAYEFVFYAADGSELVVGPVVGQSADTDDKAPMQALSQAAKYALLQAFCIPTEDMADGDAGSRVEAEGGRVAASPPAEPVPASEETLGEVERLLGLLDGLVDAEKSREFAAVSQQQAEQTVRVLTKRLAEANGGGS